MNRLPEPQGDEFELKPMVKNQYVSNTEEEISVLDLLIVLSRDRYRILRTMLALGLLGLILALVLPVQYTATTSILPPQQNTSGTAALLAQLGSLESVASLGGISMKNPSDLQVALLKSRSVQDAVISRFHLMEQFRSTRSSDARKKLEKIVDIETSTKDPLIRVSVTDPNARHAADLANGYIDEFKKFSATLAVTEASQRRVFFEQQLLQAKEKLADAEEDLKRTEQSTGVIQLDSQAMAAIESVARLRAEVAAKEVEIRGLRAFGTGENPQVQVAEEQLAGLKSQLERMGAEVSGKSPVLIPKGDIQQTGLEYVRKLRDVRYYETIFNLLARQLEVAKLDEARQGAAVQVVDVAVVPDRHSSPKRVFIVAGSLVLGFIIGVAWSFSREAIAKLERNPTERRRLETLKLLFRRTKIRSTDSHLPETADEEEQPVQPNA